MKRIDPLFDKKRIEMKASIDNNSTNDNSTKNYLVGANDPPPLSPVSNQPMQLVECGVAGNSRKIMAWVHTGDRIVIPAKE